MYHALNFLEHLDEYTYDDRYIYCNLGVCRLRRHDAALAYDPFGEYEEATIQLREIQGTAIRQFTGVAAEYSIPDGTSINYQASTDGGTTWLWYNGTAWLTAGGGDWSTLVQLDAGVGSLTGQRIKIRAKLTPNSDQDETPLLIRVYVFYEAVWAYFEDLKRSIKRFIDAGNVCYLAYSEQLAAASSTVALATAWTVIGVDAVYNLTVDPGRTTNLYQSYAGGIVTLTGSAASGSVIEISYRGSCSVFLAADENLQVSEVPSIVVVLPRAREDKYGAKNLFDYEPLVSLGVVRRREVIIPTRSMITIYEIGATDVETCVLNDMISELFEPEPWFRSLAVGQDFFCLTYEPIIDNDIISTGLHVKATQLSVMGNKELRAYHDVPSAATITLESMGAQIMQEPGGYKIPPSSSEKSNSICSTLPAEEGDIEYESPE